MPNSLRPLRRPLFTLFWGGGVISDIGTWVQLVTIGTLVASASGKATSTALIAAATFGPQGLCSPIGGLLADRHDRRRNFLMTLGMQTIMTTIIAVAVARGLRDANTLALMVVVQAGAGALGAPSFSAILPDLVPRDELLAASSLSLMGWNAGRVLGPALAGVLQVAGAGPAWAISVNAASFLVLWCAVASVRRSFRPPAATFASVGVELRTGIRALISTPGCRTAVLALALVQLTLIPFVGLIPYMATEVLHRAKGTAGLLNSVQGLTAIMAMLTVPTLVTRYGRSSMARVSSALAALSMVVYITSTGVVQAVIGVGLLGVFITAMVSLFGSLAPRDAPADKRGRVLSLYTAAGGTTYGLGLMLFGWLADVVGIRPVFLCGAAIMAGCSFVLGRRTGLRRIVDGTDPPPTHPLSA